MNRPSVLECTPVLPLLPICARLGPPSLRQFFVKLIPSKSIRRVRDMVKLMDLTALQILSTKKVRAENKVGGGKDLIDILCASFPSFYIKIVHHSLRSAR